MAWIPSAQRSSELEVSPFGEAETALSHAAMDFFDATFLIKALIF